MLSDLRFALRRLWKNPAFTIAAVLTLGLAIGASTATFSAVNAVLLRGMPYPDADRLTLLWGDNTARGDHRGQVCFPDVEDYRAHSKSFEDIAAFSGYWSPSFAGADGAESLGGMRVSDAYFRVIQARMALGRAFDAKEQWDGAGAVVIISHGLWERRFGKDPAIVGNTVRLSGKSYTMVGVLAADVHSLPTSLTEHAADVYRPLSKDFSDEIRSGRHLRAIGRLKAGVTLAQAQAELDNLSRGMAAEHPESNKNRGIALAGLQADSVRQVRPALMILQGCVMVVLLLACGNVANLSLAQFASRRKELAIRGALGAGRMRLMRQMLAESIVLAALAGAAGVLVAAWSLPLVQTLGAKVLPEMAQFNLDWRVAAFAAAVSLASGLAFGLAPAWISSSLQLNDALKSGGRGVSGGGGRLRSLLVVAEMAGALALLVCAALLVGSFIRLRGVYPGFESKNTLVAEIKLPGARYPNGPERQVFYERLLAEINAIPGVAAAGAVSVLPESSNFNQMAIEVEGRVMPEQDLPSPDQYEVTPGYFKAFSINLNAGRNFTAADDQAPGHPQVMIVNETAAARLWPGENPIGRHARTGGKNGPMRTIVGVVGDVYQYGLDSQKTMQVYVPYAQNRLFDMDILVRGTSDPTAFSPAIRRALQEIDPELPVNFFLMDKVMADSVAGRRFSMTIMAAFGFCAVLLAAIGIYGVISYTVAQRTSEFGIRLALGAQRSHILTLVIGGGAGWIALGLALGLASGLALTHYLAALLFGVSAHDPLTYLAASVFLAAVALLASYVPARRATRVDPIVALRAE